MTLRPSLLQSILIGICLLLTATLLYLDQPAYPSPISDFGTDKVMSGTARLYENLDIEMVDEANPTAGETGDSVALNSRKAQAALEVLLDGLHYMTPAYATYTAREYDNGLVLCHFPRFLLTFYDAQNRVSHYFSICFECSNVRMRNGTEHPKSQEYMMTIEGIQAFKKLQKQMFFQRGMMSDSLLFN